MEQVTLKDKIVLITGAGRGIGRAIALKMAQKGARVAANDVHLENVEPVVKEIQERGGQALGVAADISKKNEVMVMVQRIVSRFETVHILVNNAGIEQRSPLLEHKEEVWQRIIDVNLKGPFFCCQVTAPLMMAQKWGRIINISSMAYRGQGGQAAYDASKGGLNALTKSVAIDLAPYDITVNAICPSWVETAMTLGPEAEELKDKLLKRMPLKRLARPEEIAAVACFLATDQASYITGANINVDGAWLR
jgi:3-oxoacyl-[acyl-carrier protein] reductase